MTNEERAALEAAAKATVENHWGALLANPTAILELLAENAALRQALNDLWKRADYVRVPSDGDWACIACRPESDMLIAGFRCAYHQSGRLLADTPSVKPMNGIGLGIIADSLGIGGTK